MLEETFEDVAREGASSGFLESETSNGSFSLSPSASSSSSSSSVP